MLLPPLLSVFTCVEFNYCARRLSSLLLEEYVAAVGRSSLRFAVWHVVIYRGGRKINWQLNDTPCEDDKRHLVAQEEVGSEGLCNEGLMTIHKWFSVRWSTQLGSSALESRRCHFLSPQKGAAIDGVGCEREITQNSAPGLSQVTCRRNGSWRGGTHTHLAHYRCHRRTKNSKSGRCECAGLTAADTFSHEKDFGALFLVSARILFVLLS